MKRVVVTGASSGVGAALARQLAARGDEVIGLSRRPAAAGRWVAADLGDPAAIGRAAQAIGPGPLDALVHVAGIWEAEAFGPGYDFATEDPAEVQRVLAVNLAAPVLLTQALIPLLSRGPGHAGGRLVFIGSTSGLDRIGTPEVAYNASKAGLRAAAQAMAAGLSGRGIAVTMVNPGDIACEDDPPEAGMATGDLCAAILMALDLSSRTVIEEMTLQPRRG